jgi:hypothetical protein
MNWLGKMIGLPEAFLHTHNESKGGGVIQVLFAHHPLLTSRRACRPNFFYPVVFVPDDI